MKCKFPDKNEVVKEIGHKILDMFQFPMPKAFFKKFEMSKSNDSTTQLKLFQELYNSFDFFRIS